MSEGWKGWDAYARFYDWENARTLGRRDIAFWRRLAASARGPVLELGSGTGRVTVPLARAGIDVIGIDRSASMLERARRRGAREARRRALGAKAARSIRFVRGDIRALPFRERTFAAVLAPYGVLQSLIRSRDLNAALDSVARVLPIGGTFAIDLVPDVATWDEYTNQQRLRGRIGAATLTLFETVRRNRTRRLTMFEERFVLRRGRQTREYRFDLVFRTLTMPDMTRLLRRRGFAIDATLGDYRGGPWHARADVWIILAKKV